MLARVSPLFLTMLLVGCVPAVMFDRIDYFHMAARLHYQGFSFERPPGPEWYFLQSEQTHTSVIVRRDFWNPSKTHSFYARVSLGALDRQPESHEDFAELARSPEQEAPYKTTLVSYEQEPVRRQNQWCIRFRSKYDVAGAPPAPDAGLTMTLKGYRCLHPTWPKTTLDFFFSERGVVSELDPDLSKEGETFLNGVRIDAAPNTPAE